MTRSAPKPKSIPASHIGAADRWIARAAAVTVAGLAGVAGALSYSHMRQLAQDHGQVGWHAHAFPLSVDGIEIVASLVLLANRRAGRRSSWLPWIALTAGTTGSLAANIATAHPDLVSRIIAGWPALALLLAIKLLAGILEHGERRESRSTIVPGPVFAATNLDRPDPVTAALVTEAANRPEDSSGVRETVSTAKQSDITHLYSAAALLPAARLARDELHRDGLTLTRDALGARLRRHGYPIRNANVTSLLHRLRHELAPASTNDEESADPAA